MRARVVVVQPNALGQSSSPAILDGSFEFRQRLAIPVRIYCGPFRHKLGKQDAFSGGQRFNTDGGVGEAVSGFIDGLAAEFFEEGFQKWITRQEKCVEKSGDCVEK